MRLLTLGAQDDYASNLVVTFLFGRISIWVLNTLNSATRCNDTTNEEVGGFTIGKKLPIVDAQLDEVRDVAALRLDPNYTLPDGPEFYHMCRSVPLMKWDEKELDELSLLMFGFPIANSREVTTEGKLG